MTNSRIARPKIEERTIARTVLVPGPSSEDEVAAATGAVGEAVGDVEVIDVASLVSVADVLESVEELVDVEVLDDVDDTVEEVSSASTFWSANISVAFNQLFSFASNIASTSSGFPPVKTAIPVL